jgi:hypothetical protein
MQLTIAGTGAGRFGLGCLLQAELPGPDVMELLHFAIP